MAKSVSKSEFKPKALELLRQVENSGEPLTLRGALDLCHSSIQ